ncbi:amidohydrolase [Erythrobacter westpacificensis]|uniref:Amidohydrolase n=1 Tax=Erythrobacter westpacificensis TaxID=1055231 RepID=A0ABP9JZ53_9SPHN
MLANRTPRNRFGRACWTVSGSLAALLCTTPAVAGPDLIVVNGDVYTVDEEYPRAEAFAVEDGKFTAIGTNEEIRALADSDTQVITADGKTVTPGFIDSHAHFSGNSKRLNLYVQSRDEWADLLRTEHQRLGADDWLLGGNWDHTIIDDVLPTKEFLDEVVGDRPTVLTHIDGHFVWVNSAVIDMAGITADTPVPPGGQIVVDPETGEPTGILKEGAVDLVRALIPRQTDEERYASLPAAIQYANSLGITGMHNMTAYDDWLHVLQQGGLTMRMWHGFFGGFDPANDPMRQSGSMEDKVAGLRAEQQRVRELVDATGFESEVGPLFEMGFVKLINDGVLSVHTAVLLDAYRDQPGWTGGWFVEPDELAATVAALEAGGFQVAIHSIGDGAVRASLDAFEASRPGSTTDLPMRIEHVELLSKEDLPRFAELDVVASMTPNHMTKAVAYIEERIEPAREDRAYTWQSLLDTGATVMFGADGSTSIHLDPLKQIGDAMYRTNHVGFNEGEPWHSEQALTFAQALKAYTLSPAETTSWGEEIGSITVGKWADFVILGGTVAEPVDPAIFDMGITATYFAGRPVFEAQ